MKGNIQQVALTGGVVWGVILFLTTLGGVYFNYGINFLNGVASIYPGYSISLPGSVIGLIYGFLDVYIGVYIVTWVYKKLGR